MLPEVIFLAQAHNMGGIDADLLGPDFKGFVVVFIDGNPQSVDGQLQHLLVQNSPRPSSGLVLEIIAEGEVAQHLKEGAVPRRDAHALDVGRADAFWQVVTRFLGGVISR